MTAASVAPVSNGDSTNVADYDLELPTKGFSSIPDAMEDVRQGKIIVVVDNEDVENEGYIITAAQKITPESIAFITNHGNGNIFVTLKEEDLERLEVPFKRKENDELRLTVDAKHGISTGESADDKATTVLALASRTSKPDDLSRPGHIFLLKYREGGVVKRARHSEASVDLVRLAGLDPVAVLSGIVDDNGSTPRSPKAREFAEQENLKIITIADLIRYRKKKDKLVELISAARLPTKWGTFTAHCYRSLLEDIEQVAMVKGDIGDGLDVLVRVHSECLTGDIFGSEKCDCGNQLALAMQKIASAGRGILVYMRGHEGRGIGLGQKLRAYNLQDAGRDTVEANVELGLPVDSRDYTAAAQMLKDLGVRTIKLITNNPAKPIGLRGYGLVISGTVPSLTVITEENKKYLETKRTRMGHVYGPPDAKGLLINLVNGDAAAVPDS